jgi:dTDP-4-amino-4,6-dideoxygalactose transaminase
VIRLQTEHLARTHREVFEALRAADIGVNLHYIPVHTQPYYQAMGFRPNDYPRAIEYYCEAISLPMYQGLTEDQQDQVVSALTHALQ